MNAKIPKPSESIEARLVRETIKERNIIISKFPLPFALLGAFGLVVTFYGFEHLIDQVPLLVNNPIILLLIGVVCLMVTGKFYKKLD